MAKSNYSWKDDNPSSRRKAAAATGVAQVALLLLLFFNGFVTPLPLPGERGMAIAFGTQDGGLGHAPRAAQGQTTTHSEPLPTNHQQEVSPLTQDFEEAPAIQQEQKPKMVKPTANHTKQQPKPTPPAPPKRQVDQSALFPGAPAAQNDQGIGNGSSAGNQGIPNAPVYTGKPGGNSETQENGNGKGRDGSGISYSLGGRVALQLPTPEYPKQQGGRVVVKVWVNRNGKVVRAEPGEPGSTTFDQSLLTAAKNAALQAQFDVAASSPDTQVGTISYVFQLKQ